MRILILGASGLIGLQLAARLLQRGDDVVGIARRVAEASRQLPRAAWLKVDIGAMRNPDDWRDWLDGIGAVVNFAGVHRDECSLYWARTAAGMRRVVHISAIGVDVGDPACLIPQRKDHAFKRLQQFLENCSLHVHCFNKALNV